MNSIAAWEPNPAIIEMKQRTLELRRYAAQVGIGRTTLESMEMEKSEDILTRNILYRVELDVLSDKIADDKYKARYSYKVYASPWQHFKALYMPKWFVSRYPVKKQSKSGNVQVRFTRYATYPKANIALQRDKRFYEVMLGGYEAIHDNVTQEI